MSGQLLSHTDVIDVTVGSRQIPLKQVPSGEQVPLHMSHQVQNRHPTYSQPFLRNPVLKSQSSMVRTNCHMPSVEKDTKHTTNKNGINESWAEEPCSVWVLSVYAYCGCETIKEKEAGRTGFLKMPLRLCFLDVEKRFNPF